MCVCVCVCVCECVCECGALKAIVVKAVVVGTVT